MKIAIVGTGAMGSIYAAQFADCGQDVYAVDTWADHVSAINERGLTIDGPTGVRTVPGIRAATALGQLPACDLYVIATKGGGVGAAARDIAASMDADSLVLTIQNGLGAGERIAEHMATDNVLLGVADGFGAAMIGPGHAKHNAMKLIRLGEMKGGLTERLERLESAWRAAGFNVESFEDIHQLIWEKFICNVGLSAPCALFDCTIGELLANPESRNISIGCMLEAYHLGLKEGVSFSFDDPVAYLETFVSAMPNANPSLQQDYRAKRRSEIDAINGMVPVVGLRHDFPTPYNETVTALIRAQEAKLR
jgi:2-dehydropantoate 2-reductase